MNIVDNIKREFRTANSLNKIIYINVLVFLVLNIFSVFFSLFMIDIYNIKEKLMLPSDIDKLITKPWSLITYMFIHDNFIHLLFNMIWLHFGGKLFLQYLNQKQLINIYILGGISGGILFIMAFNYFPAFTLYSENAKAIGASASVLAVVFALTTYTPNYSIQIPLIGYIKLKHIAIFYIILDFLSIPKGNAGGHIAHLGGALFGYLYIINLRKKSKSKSHIDTFIKYLINIFTPLKSKTIRKKEKNNSQKEIDIVLEKISKSGYNSLNKEEKDLLFKSSKK